ncbi:carbamoyltransferase HypF [Corynebacterium uropygiale]|uniref:Carbamoyltransferase n=1 Tax=Corynebacterium uropygiale TaxID=1775911 RepID=A0A9X1QPW6_9CORY|nr:carbamoyltransferase HypF [Corynebacterium uropygiale]MCF4007179.1 carbamoyltransferase HypF [Corynebacterium uropygiale]
MCREVRELRLRGVVQGVGFRPHVARIARRHGIRGTCLNDDTGVQILAWGTPAQLDAFRRDLLGELPPLAHVLSADEHPIAPPPGPAPEGFRILASAHAPGQRTLIPPDVATCPECLAEMRDPTNRRYRYPFTTCTHCGPRLSIIEALPYDRPNTTLRVFPLCPSCQREYTDPEDRRYHAQPISCPDCGPRLWFEAPGEPGGEPGEPGGVIEGTEPALAAARRLLEDGGILALKGLGGFHLLCDAARPEAIARLRRLKRRPDKPLALMVPDVEGARALTQLSEADAQLLISPAHPILLAPLRPEVLERIAGATTGKAQAAAQIAPGLREWGIMLPYTPIHHLLLDPPLDRPLVVTSGNPGGEPIEFDEQRARTSLRPFCDGFLLHDRGIHLPVEDSVLRAGGPGGQPIPVRRARGYAPLPVPLPEPWDSGPVVLGVGGELKNTCALAIDDLAHLSSHHGDMGSLRTQESFERSVRVYEQLRGERPELLVCDLHPGYATTTWAERYCAEHDVPLLRVQHHLAHALSLLAEHGRGEEPAVVAVLDGTGYGTDGAIWGAELLRVEPSRRGCERQPLIPEFPLLGGDRAIRQPWRLLLAQCRAWGIEPPPLDVLRRPEAELLRAQLDAPPRVGQRWPPGAVACTSLGRVLDAAAVALGLVDEQTFEGQAPMLLEAQAAAARERRPSRARSIPDALRELLHEQPPSTPAPERAWTFLHGIAAHCARELEEAARRAGLRVVGVSGGCAVNVLFIGLLGEVLGRHGIELLTHRVVPPNDGGLSLGQVLAGRAALR